MAFRKGLAALAVIVALGALVLGVSAVSAASTPVITGEARGLELCPQFRCDAAIFAGRFIGTVDQVSDPNGTWSIAIQHGPVPREAGESTDLTGGLWALNVAGKTFRGFVSAGTLTNTDGGLRGLFQIEATFVITRGGSGTLSFEGVLDHRNLPFVPVIGTISQ